MKRATRPLKLLCFTIALLTCLTLLAACGNDGTTDSTTEQLSTQTESEIHSETETETKDSSTSENSSETETETETETSTETESNPPEQPELKTSLSFAELSADTTLSDYFYGNYQCKATLTSLEEDGQVIALTTANTPSAASSSDPYVYFRYSQLIKDLGYDMASTRDYPHLVLRVRSVGRTGSVFSLFGYNTKNPSGAGTTGQLDAYVNNADEWQYIYFDLSSFKKNLLVYRLDITNFAIADGETLYISDIAFYATAEEAHAHITPDTYPILEQTAQDYVAKIMSFNVQTENGTQVRADIRMAMLRDLIDEYMPDSIGMQEVTTKWREMMDSYCFNQSYASVGEPRTPGGEANPIYYRSDKFDLVDSGTFWLSDTPDVAGSQFEESLYVRICTWAHLRDKATGKEYVHVNTHLDNLGSSDGRSLRTKQIVVILKFLQRFGDMPMVMTGDLNQAAVNSEGNQYAVYKTLTGAKAFELDGGTKAYSPFSNARYDAADNMPEGICATMTTYYDESGSKYNPAKEPIDYVLYTGASLTALSYKIRLYDVGGLYLSDHLPVISEIKFTPTPTAE